VIGDRALSDDPEVAARFGAAIIRTMQTAASRPAASTFPVTAIPTWIRTKPAGCRTRRPPLEAVEFVPFRRAIEADVATIMTAHVHARALDRDRIASFSPTVVTSWLKQKLGFAGVVISDDLGMKAVSATTPLPEASVSAIAAGCDTVLLCNSSADEQWQANRSHHSCGRAGHAVVDAD
jgi:beta-N-acetylhexosaminidase